MLPSGNPAADLGRVQSLGFNWAAFLMPYPWLLGHGRLTWGMILLISACLPVVGFAHVVVYPAMAWYLGRHGYELAWTHAPFHSVEEMVDREREWLVWGIVFKVFFLLGIILTAIYLLWLLQQPAFVEIYKQLYNY